MRISPNMIFIYGQCHYLHSNLYIIASQNQHYLHSFSLDQPAGYLLLDVLLPLLRLRISRNINGETLTRMQGKTRGTRDKVKNIIPIILPQI